MGLGLMCRGSALVAMDLGFMGPNYSISTACATANYCFVAAANHIRKGDADIIIAGGSEAPIIPVGLGGFVACRCSSFLCLFLLLLLFLLWLFFGLLFFLLPPHSCPSLVPTPFLSALHQPANALQLLQTSGISMNHSYCTCMRNST